MRLVGDDGKRTRRQRHLAADGLQHKGEGLDGDDDDWPPLDQRLDQLVRLDALVADLVDDAVLVLELEDGVLQLLVEHGAVGDDDDAVKNIVVGGVVQAGQLVRQPGDRVGLARPGRVLHQVLVPRALGARGRDELRHHLPLVVAGEDDPLLLLFLLQVDKAPEDLQEAVAAQHPLPQVAGAVAQRVRRVACALVVPQVEGQEHGLGAGQPRGHVDLVGADGEVHQRPPLEGQQRLLLPGPGVAWRPVVLVLANGVLHRLREIGLEFERGERNAVGKQHHVDAVLVLEAVVHLPHTRSRTWSYSACSWGLKPWLGLNWHSSKRALPSLNPRRNSASVPSLSSSLATYSSTCSEGSPW